MVEKSLIQVYMGSSDKFHFAPLGLGLRASGQNLHTLIICFSPHKLMDAAITASSILKPNLVIDYSAIEGMHIGEKFMKDKVLDSFQKAKNAALTGNFDIVILNGVLQVINQEVISLEDILTLMEKKSDNVELVFSGSSAPEDIIKKADLVTEMVEHGPTLKPEKENTARNKGTIEVITGNGKGKTTYCIGKAMLMSCLGTRSSILQFIKSPKPYGEVKAIEKFPLLEIRSMGEGFLDLYTTDPQKKHVDAARQAWKECLKEIFSLKYGLVVLDEIDNAIHYGLVNPERVREMLFLKPEKLSLILSGRNAHPAVMDAATTVIEMKEIKHPFTKGIKARMGIEF
ncbi:MAG: cob(I)yrinic acid a,c-diamide adenosyltransferase [Desulfobacteraceae bacterium]|nr:cob(I)yrinic acid a,c-diamide adenosyltransferase [Desulfobacteraceae bacterium]